MHQLAEVKLKGVQLGEEPAAEEGGEPLATAATTE
jgi:hypothetical protein